MAETAPRTIVEVPWRTIFKLLAAAALVWLWLTLLPWILVLMVAVLLAVTLNPLVERLERAGLPRWAAAVAVGAIVIATVAGLAWFTWASLSEQGRYVADRFRTTEGDLFKLAPPWVRSAIGAKDGDTLQSFVAPWASRIGQSVISAITVTLLGFVLTLYLLIEANETRDWLLAFVPQANRGRVKQTLSECERIIFAYVSGNFITSVIATITTLAALSWLQVPAALLLAIIAGLSDFLPVIGFIIGAVPTILLALTVSPTTALLAAAFYLAYNTIENYLISPWAYGGRLKLSNVAVLLAFVIGAEVAGVIGALIALPVAAAYPTIERLWLRDQLPNETVREHEAAEAEG